MEKTRTKLQRINRNSALQTFSNFLLASSLAFSGTGFVDLFSKEPRFTMLASFLFILIGCFTLASACGVHKLKETEDDDDDA